MIDLSQRPEPKVAETYSQPKIRAEKVDFYYSKFQALKQITIDIPANCVVALIGPSGCGKSTFLRCINRMNDLILGTRLEGKILLDNEDLYSENMDVVGLRRRVGMVFQRPNPFAKSIYDNIAFGPRIHGIKNKDILDGIIESSLRRAYLWEEVKDKLKSSALQLSGGQQQRLCIARVLAVEPEVILMDEPTAALDPTATFRIEELFNDLKSDYSVLIVTHSMQQAARSSDYTAFFMLGELVEYNSTPQLFQAPRKKQTEDYILGRFG